MGWVCYLGRRPSSSSDSRLIDAEQITRPYELYLAMSPLLPKSAVVNAANAIARWVQKEEKRLFLRDAPVF